MKIAALIRYINDYGTKPRIKVLKHMDGMALLVYEGTPGNATEDVQRLTVSSFTVLGTGFIEIHAK